MNPLLTHGETRAEQSEREAPPGFRGSLPRHLRRQDTAAASANVSVATQARQATAIIVGAK